MIARHIGYFGNSGPKQLLPDLFGTATTSSTIDLPSGLVNLATRTSDHKLGVAELIYQHTLFPYYSKFMSNERNAEIVDSMLNKSGDIHTRCGINAGEFSSVKMPRYCPMCYEEDLDTHEETFFRRAHQIPSMRICTIHNVYLCELKSNAESINKNFFVKPKALIQRSLHFTKPNQNNGILEIGKKIVELLNGKSLPNFENTPFFYNEAIKQLGFRKGKVSLQIEEIYKAFNDFYDSETLEHYKSSVDIANQSCWLKAIFRKHRKGFDPVRHVLVLNFIEHLKSNKRCESFEEKKSEIYACRNPVCRDFNSNENTHHYIQIDPKSKREITYVKCECGYSYTKSYIKSKNSWFIRVKTFGKLWETELKKLIKSGRSRRSIAEELHADSKTIMGNLNRIEKKKSGTKVVLKQKEWMQLRKSFPRYSITELRSLKSSTYTYLYRHCKGWLLHQDYSSKSRIVKCARINWKQRDIQLVKEVTAAYEQLRAEYPKRRISKTSLLKLIGKDSLFRVNEEKLPKLSSLLEEKSESLESFRLRRLALTANELLKTKQRVSYWKVLRAAGIRKEYVTESIHAIALKIVDGSINRRMPIEKVA